jgi:hypothetical protein
MMTPKYKKNRPIKHSSIHSSRVCATGCKPLEQLSFAKSLVYPRNVVKAAMMFGNSSCSKQLNTTLTYVCQNQQHAAGTMAGARLWQHAGGS